MTDYFSAEGLSELEGFESSGVATAQNPHSTASGLYGFTNPTWLSYAPQAGVDTSLYPTAKSAPAELQTQVAQITPASNWLCTNCDENMSNAVASNPGLVTSYPGLGFTVAPSSDAADFFGEATTPEGGGLASDTGNDFSGGAVNLDQYGLPIQAGDVQAITQQPSLGGIGGSPDWWQQLVGDIETLAARFGLILLGALLLFAAAYAMSNHDMAGSLAHAVA